MLKILSYLCCCCPCIKKQRKTKKKVRPESKIDENELTQIYRIPDQFPTVTDCLTAQELEIDFRSELGKGGYATVYKALDLKTSTDIACKRIRLTDRGVEGLKELRNELTIMTKCKSHENIIQVFKHFIIDENYGQKNCYIFMELASGGTLLDEIAVVKRLKESLAKDYFRQICMGLKFLHRNNIAHKDLKPSNVLIVIKPDLSKVVKISDFGISRIQFNERNGKIIKDRIGAGTPNLMSPQMLKLYIYQEFNEKVAKLRCVEPFKADIWALGICLFYMICGEFPFNFKDRDLESCKKMFQTMTKPNKRYTISYNCKITYSADCFDLIEQLIEPEVSKRLNIYTVLDHRWLRNN